MIRLTPDTEDIFAVLPFTVEDDFSYFCKYDELTGVVDVPSDSLPSIDQSCYLSREQVFDMLLR